VNYLYDAGPSGATVSNSIGRITASSQVTNTITYQFPLYTYNRAGALLSETYPTNRVVATGYDGANRPAYLQGTLGTSVTPYIGVKSDASNWIQYWPTGEPWAFCRGSASSSLCHAASLNGRLQVVEAINNQDGPTSMLFLSCPGWGFSNDNNYGSLETAAELCEPTSIDNAWCEAAASKDSKGARVFEARSTSPKNGQFVSLPDGYGGVHSIKSTPSGLLIVASDEDPKTAAPTNLRLFVKHDNGGVISTSPVLPPCDVTNVQTSPDELVGLFDCSETRRSVLDTYYTAKRNAVVFSIQSLQILAEIPDSKNRRASGAIMARC